MRAGGAAWFTPQEIEAVEQDQRDAKRMFLLTVVVSPVNAGGCGWAVGFGSNWFIVLVVMGVFAIASTASAWRVISRELDIMRAHQTQAHRSFFDGPVHGTAVSEPEGN
jgi:hypothetical protein